MQKHYPKLVVEYQFVPNSEVERLIAEHKVDIGLMTRLSTMGEVSLKPIAEEELLLVTPSGVLETSWGQLIELGFSEHSYGAYHAGQLLSVNFPEFQKSNQFKRSGFSN